MPLIKGQGETDLESSAGFLGKLRRLAKRCGVPEGTAWAIIVGVAITVISTAVLEVGDTISLVAVIRWVWEFLVGYHLLPGWVIVVVTICGLFGLVSIAARVLRASKVRSHMSYVEDEVFDMRWRWQWSGSSVTKLRGFCRKCDLEVDRLASSYANAKCDQCHMGMAFKLDMDTNRVRLEIERRARTGDLPDSRRFGEASRQPPEPPSQPGSHP